MVNVTIENLNYLPVFFMGEFSGRIESTVHIGLEHSFNLDGREVTQNEIYVTPDISKKTYRSHNEDIESFRRVFGIEW